MVAITSPGPTARVRRRRARQCETAPAPVAHPSRRPPGRDRARRRHHRVRRHRPAAATLARTPPHAPTRADRSPRIARIAHDPWRGNMWPPPCPQTTSSPPRRVRASSARATRSSVPRRPPPRHRSALPASAPRAAASIGAAAMMGASHAVASMGAPGTTRPCLRPCLRCDNRAASVVFNPLARHLCVDAEGDASQEGNPP